MKNKKVVYHACIQKSGSQWIKKIFQDFVIDKDEYNVIVPNKNYFNKNIEKKN
jgi:hypothetical protein